MPSPPRLAKCLDIARLSRNHNKLSHINTRATTPGSVYPLLYRDKKYTPKDLLDPSHPAAKLPVADRAKLRPIWRSAYFDLDAFPKAWLVRDEDAMYHRPWSYTQYPEQRLDGMRKLDVSLVFSRRGDYICPDKFIWTTVKRKLRTALQLVVTRGARVQNSSSSNSTKSSSLVFDDTEAGANRWVKTDWTYVFLPKNELYFLNINQSVGVMRDALTYIMKQAKLREDHGWAIPAYTVKKGGINNRTLISPVRGSVDRTGLPKTNRD